MFTHKNLWLLLGALVLSFAAGCMAEKPPQQEAGEPGLTAQDARQALIEMLEQQKDDRNDSFQLKALRAGEGMVIKDETSVGISTLEWNCYLEAKRFTFIRPGGCTLTCYGVFEYPDGRWQARITGREWACRMFGDEKDKE